MSLSTRGQRPRFLPRGRIAAEPQLRSPAWCPGCCAHPPRGSWLPAWERSRQPEPWEHAALEAGQGADTVAGEGEDVEAGPVADAVRGAQVGPERRLAVGPGGHQVEPAARAEQAGAEAGHD